MLNYSQRPFYMLLCIKQWLSLVLDLIVGALAVVLVAVATSTAGSLSPGASGRSFGADPRVQLSAHNDDSVCPTPSPIYAMVCYYPQSLDQTRNLYRRRCSRPPTRPIHPPPNSRDSQRPHHNGHLMAPSPSATSQPATNPQHPPSPPSPSPSTPAKNSPSAGHPVAAKTSLVMALLNMVSLYPRGRITLDGIDILSLGSNTLRSRG